MPRPPLGKHCQSQTNKHSRFLGAGRLDKTKLEHIVELNSWSFFSVAVMWFVADDRCWRRCFFRSRDVQASAWEVEEIGRKVHFFLDSLRGTAPPRASYLQELFLWSEMMTRGSFLSHICSVNPELHCFLPFVFSYKLNCLMTNHRTLRPFKVPLVLWSRS